MKRCAATWRTELMDHLVNIRLILAVGLYAIRWHMPQARGSLTEIVKTASTASKVVPMPHPSPRNNIWLSKNLWFEKEVVPALRKRVGETLSRG